jgi:hypothetical protein
LQNGNLRAMIDAPINDLEGGGGACCLHKRARMRKWSAVLCLSFVIAVGCGGSSPSGPDDGSGSRVLEGRTVSAIDGVATPGVALVVGTRNVTADSTGYFRLDVDGPSTFNLHARGSDIVERETTLSGPGAEPARVTLIPASFDLESFNQMFRPSGGLQRWTARPGLVVLASVMSYSNGNRDEYAATSEQLSEEEVALLIAHLTEGLSVLTSGTFTSFASVDVERPSAGTRASVNRPGKIVMGRYNGIVSFANTIGFGQWALVSDGSVGGGAMFLDRDFDRNDGRRRLLRIHELGHALGLMHVTERMSIMNPSLGPDVSEFDRAAAAIAFQRPPKNQAPDTDPAGTLGTRSTDHAMVWQTVYCR